MRFERIDGKDELIVSPLDKVEEPASLVALRTAIAGRLPRVDLPEILLESRRVQISPSRLRTSANARRGSRILASASAPCCWRKPATPASSTRAPRVAAQTGIPLARAWGGGEVASADGLRFVVPVRTVHAGPNPKYFGIGRGGRGVTYYNLVSDQFTGLHGIRGELRPLRNPADGGR